jgi:hypothetical protein
VQQDLTLIELKRWFSSSCPRAVVIQGSTCNTLDHKLWVRIVRLGVRFDEDGEAHGKWPFRLELAPRIPVSLNEGLVFADVQNRGCTNFTQSLQHHFTAMRSLPVAINPSGRAL